MYRVVRIYETWKYNTYAQEVLGYYSTLEIAKAWVDPKDYQFDTIEFIEEEVIDKMPTFWELAACIE